MADMTATVATIATAAHIESPRVQSAQRHKSFDFSALVLCIESNSDSRCCLCYHFWRKAMKELFDLLKSVLGSNAGSFGVVAFALWGIVAATRKIERILADHDTLSKSVEKIEKLLTSLQQDVMVIKADMEAKRDRSDKKLIKAHSPVSLTEDGLEVARALRADAMLDSAWGKIESAIREAVPSGSAYDVQQFCLERLAIQPEKFFDADSVEAMKRYAFNNGITLFQVASVIGVLARDRFLKRGDCQKDK